MNIKMGRKRRNDSKIDLTYTAPNGRAMTGHEWCEVLGISTWAFRYRLRKHGTDNPRTYMDKKASMALQRTEHANPGRRKKIEADRKEGIRLNRGNAEWQALGNTVRG